jgi:hypothetical protein
MEREPFVEGAMRERDRGFGKSLSTGVDSHPCGLDQTTLDVAIDLAVREKEPIAVLGASVSGQSHRIEVGLQPGLEIDPHPPVRKRRGREDADPDRREQVETCTVGLRSKHRGTAGEPVLEVEGEGDRRQSRKTTDADAESSERFEMPKFIGVRLQKGRARRLGSRAYRWQSDGAVLEQHRGAARRHRDRLDRIEVHVVIKEVHASDQIVTGHGSNRRKVERDRHPGLRCHGGEQSAGGQSCIECRRRRCHDRSWEGRLGVPVSSRENLAPEAFVFNRSVGSLSTKTRRPRRWSSGRSIAKDRLLRERWARIEQSDPGLSMRVAPLRRVRHG